MSTEPDATWQRVEAVFLAPAPPFPTEALAEVATQAARHAPRCLELLHETVARARAGDETVLDESRVHLAVVLLACWRDTRAWEPMLQLLQLPWDTVDALLGDALHETVSRALAAVCPGDLTPLEALLHDESRSEWVRLALLDAWTLRVQMGDAPAEALESRLIELGEREVARMRADEEDDDVLLGGIVSSLADIGSERCRLPVLSWFDAGLIDRSTIGVNEFVSALTLPEPARKAAFERHGRAYPTDPRRELCWWASWQPREPASQAPTTRMPGSSLKIGRNDPCPCGSGRKFKKCHGAVA
jgi:hypothetical protein